MRTNVLQYLEETVKRVPDKIAFTSEDESISFNSLFCKARSIGTTLIADGFNNDPIVVLMQRQARAVAAFLGVVYSGCYYVPLDADLSQRRIGDILSNLKHTAVIYDDCALPLLQSIGYDGKAYYYKDICEGTIDDQALLDIRMKHIDTNPLYIVYTSGSTGQPKGVVASHRCVLDYIEHLSQVLGFNETTIFGNQAPLYFDACLKEIYPTLKFGATTHIIPKKLFMFPVQLIEYLNTYGINTICWVGSAITLVAAMNTFRKVKPKFLHTIAFAGEEVPVIQLNKWRQALPDAHFFNLYGPTEATGICCSYEVKREFTPDERLPLGKALPNTEILILDAEGNLVQPGEVGEIYVRGSCLTLGYYGQLSLAAKAFVQNPLQDLYFDPLYRTGDLGYLNNREELMFVSRRDYQIKHMGHRIELGDIEATAARVEGITLCCCIYDHVTNKLIFCYTGQVERSTLALQLRKILPRFMVPQVFVHLDVMPRTETGKIDRKVLMNCYVKEKEK